MTNNEKRGTKKEMEYEDAPSGFVMLYNYKEPFMPYEGGFGYQGVLMFDGVDDTVQCHLCGQWFNYLPRHLRKEHGTTAAEYKDMVGLLPSTALISESARANLIKGGLNRFQNLRPGGKKTEAEKEKIRQSMLARKDVAEKKNITGTCPAQLIERLQKRYTELGYTPDRDEIIGGHKTFESVFGSWKEACNRAGIPYRAFNEKKPVRVLPDTEKVQWIRDFYAIHGRLPKKDTRGEGLVLGRPRSDKWRELCDAALTNTALPERKFRRHTDEGLIKSLVDFKEQHGRNPSCSDCRRGLLASSSVYMSHFGSWKKALIKAGLLAAV